jgi:hypothetical protein
MRTGDENQRLRYDGYLEVRNRVKFATEKADLFSRRAPNVFWKNVVWINVLTSAKVTRSATISRRVEMGLTWTLPTKDCRREHT